jgi:hypothetical protein
MIAGASTCLTLTRQASGNISVRLVGDTGRNTCATSIDEAAEGLDGVACERVARLDL